MQCCDLVDLPLLDFSLPQPNESQQSGPRDMVYLLAFTAFTLFFSFVCTAKHIVLVGFLECGGGSDDALSDRFFEDLAGSHGLGSLGRDAELFDTSVPVRSSK